MFESRFRGVPTFIKRIAGLGLTLAVGIPVAQETNKAYESHLEAEEQKTIETETHNFEEHVRTGLMAERKYSIAFNAYNKLVEASHGLEKDSEDYQRMKAERRSIGDEISEYEVSRGIETLGLLENANPYAKALETDKAALHNLALVRTLYKDVMHRTGDDHATFSYWHNCAAGYQELGKKSEAQIREKFRGLLAYAESHNKLNLSFIPQEQILFFLLEDRFDFSLTPESVRSELEKRDPTWATEKATHSNKDSYRSFNDLTTLDIFELNRLHAVLEQINNPKFQESIFVTRDQDLTKDDTEVGGLIPRPEQDHVLHPIDAKKNGNNAAYVKPLDGAVLQFSALTDFHLHATQVNEDASVQGPSGADFSFFTPGVVFSSVDEHTIRAHFYVSRSMMDQQHPALNDVISLGTISKP